MHKTSVLYGSAVAIASAISLFIAAPLRRREKLA